MEINYFFRSQACGPSIKKVFLPIIEKMAETNFINTYYVPQIRVSVFKMLENILYVWKHRSKSGINHITGDIHYTILGLIGCKSVLTIHDTVFLTQKQNGIKSLLTWILWLYIPLKLADKITCISEKTKNEILSYININPEKIIVIHNPYIDNYQYSPMKTNPLPRILHIGTRPNKNLTRVIESLKDLDCILVIVGVISESDKQLLDSNNITYENKINISEEELIAEYRKTSIVSFPSLYEGFGMPIIEAQAIGRPILTSNIPPMMEVAGGGALFVDPLDIQSIRSGFIELMRNKKLCFNLISLGRINCAKYRVDKIVSKYYTLYKSLYKTNKVNLQFRALK